MKMINGVIKMVINFFENYIWTFKYGMISCHFLLNTTTGPNFKFMVHLRAGISEGF